MDNDQGGDEDGATQDVRHESRRGRHRQWRTQDTEEETQENNTTTHTPFPRNCTHCWIREEVKKFRLETIKAQILSKLRLTAPPNITNKNLPRIPGLARMRDEFDMQSDQAHFHIPHMDAEDDFYARTTRVINFADPRKSSLFMGQLLDIRWAKGVTTLTDESSQTNVILQFELLASILSAVCSVIQQS